MIFYFLFIFQQTQFEQTTQGVLEKLDDMTVKIDELEGSVARLMEQAEAVEEKPPQ